VVKESARYLGNIRAADGSSKPNVKKRIEAAREGFYMLSGFWGLTGVPRTVAKRVFHAMVVSAALSGMEAETPTEWDIKRLDTVLVKLARKAMGSEAAYTHTDGGRRSIPEIKVRMWMDLFTVRTMLCSRRLRWWKDILSNRGGNEQALAALFGWLRVEQVVNTRIGTVPWVEQLKRDIREAARCVGSTADPVMDCARWGDEYILDDRWMEFITEKGHKGCEKVPGPGLRR